MSKLLLCGLLICGVFIPSTAQRRTSNARRSDGRLSKQYPSVYITLERRAKIKSPENGAPEERAWLLLHNNTRWAIWFNAHGWTTKEYGDGGLFYDIENVQTHENKIGNRCHACSLIPLGAGRSFLFSIPAADLEKDSRVRINFWWAWQDQNGVAGGREFESWVYFYTPDTAKVAR
jgi:hypothetical protein